MCGPLNLKQKTSKFEFIGLLTPKNRNIYDCTVYRCCHSMAIMGIVILMGFSSKIEVSNILLPQKWYSEFEIRQKRADTVIEKSPPGMGETLVDSAK